MSKASGPSCERLVGCQRFKDAGTVRLKSGTVKIGLLHLFA
jgi:hypothetical protein